jgi:hypothetical protein
MFLVFLVLANGNTYASSEYPYDAIKPLRNMKKIHYEITASSPPICHAPINELDYVKVKYWGFDNHEHEGVLLVHQELSRDIVDIFRLLREHKFPIYKMRPPPGALQPSDDVSMAQNITVTFNCREVTDQPGILSQHSYGRAIDINPLQNPYIKGDLIIPSGGKAHIERNASHKGKITKDSLVYVLFTERGWDWGGNWNDLADYQHFEKRANGELRDRNGYPKKVL